MARLERFAKREKEKKRSHPELSLYTQNLSHTILTQEGKSQLGSEIPDSYLASFQRGSILDRSSYWKETAGDKNFGQQMMLWMGMEEGKPGMAGWLEKQTDPDVVGILQEVGLKGNPESLKTELQGDRVKNLLTTINADLKKAGENELTQEELLDPQSENYARSLIFYANYLHPTKKQHDDSRQLIETIVKQASRESNENIEETLAKLRKVAPLFEVAGKEGQHVLAALMVARAHLFDGKDLLSQVGENVSLTDDERQILAFLKKHREYPMPQALESEKGHDIQETLTRLDPEATPGHKYWVETIPADFAAQLAPEQLKSLELTKPFWTNEEGKLMVNRDVFAPAYDLAQDERFRAAEALTGQDSGLFALAAASGATPEQQRELYKTLGQTILRVHKENPELLVEFWRGQNEESRNKFMADDFNRTRPLIMKVEKDRDASVKKDFEERYYTQYNPNNLYSEGQMAFIQEKAKPFVLRAQDILQNFSQFPDRLLSLERVYSDEVNHFPLDIGEETLRVWPERIVALSESLQHDPLMLTTGQMRQIEFLSHSVDTTKIIALIKGEQTVQVDEQIAPEPEPAPHTEAEESLEENQQIIMPEEVIPEPEISRPEEERRGELRVDDSMHMDEFSTEYDDVTKYEVVDTENNLAVFVPKTREDGSITYDFNTRDPFIGTLTKEGSLSDAMLLRSIQNGLGPNMLLAYAYEAAFTPEEQKALIKNLFLQVAKIYEEHPNTRQQVGDYLSNIYKTSAVEPESLEKEISRLFSNEDVARKRLQELTTELKANNNLSLEDYRDMGLYALPFNLQMIAQRMRFTYRLRVEGSAPEASPQA